MGTEYESPPQRRLLVVNPNSNQDVTARIQHSANRVLGGNSSAVTIHPPDAPNAIQTYTDRVTAEPLCLALLEKRQGFDAYVMACFDDIAISAARRFLKAPIINSVEASITLARLHAEKFTIVTTVETMVPGIQALLARLGASRQCTVRAAGIGVAAAATGAADTLQRLHDSIEAAKVFDGAGVIILGSAGLTGHGIVLARQHGLPVVDCIEAAVLMADVAARGYAQLQAGALQAP